MADGEDGSTERHAGLARAPTRWWRLVQATVMLALLVVALFATMGQTQLPAALNFAPEPTDAAQLTDAVVQPPTEPPARPKEPERPTELPPPPAQAAQPKKDPDTRALEKRIEEALGLKASLTIEGGEKTMLTLEIADYDQLDNVVEKLTRR